MHYLGIPMHYIILYIMHYKCITEGFYTTRVDSRYYSWLLDHPKMSYFMLIFKAKMKNFGKAQLFFPNKFHLYRMESDNELCPLCQTPLKVLPGQLLPSVCNELQITCNPLVATDLIWDQQINCCFGALFSNKFCI